MSPKLQEYLGVALIALPFVSIIAFVIYIDPAKAIFTIGIPAATLTSVLAGVFLLTK